MYGFLFGILTASIEILSGLLSTRVGWNAVLDALLAPFSHERWRRHMDRVVDFFYERLTRGTYSNMVARILGNMSRHSEPSRRWAVNPQKLCRAIHRRRET